MDADKPSLPEVIDRPHAPVIYLDGAPAFSHRNGVISVTTVCALDIPLSDGVKVRTDVVPAAYLRMNAAGARSLIDALQAALLLGAPTENEAKN